MHVYWLYKLKINFKMVPLHISNHETFVLENRRNIFNIKKIIKSSIITLKIFALEFFN